MLNPSWTYLSNRYNINWAGVSVISLMVAIAMFAEQKTAIGLVCLVGVVGGVTLEYFGRKAQAKAMDLGKVKYNLTIDIQCHKRNFDKTLLHSVEDEIEMYGLAIYRAKKYLKGNWKVTEKGYLVRGFAQDVENHIAVMDIDDVTPGLAVLEKVLAGKERMRENACRVHLHFTEGGVVNVGINEKGLYLD